MSGGIPRAANTSFEIDPLRWLDDAVASGARVRWLSANQLCVLDPDLARSLLRNQGQALVEHSDFFGPAEGALAPRAAQIALARECHALVQRHVRDIDWQAYVQALGPCSVWPAAGNRMLLAVMRPVLASPDRPRSIHAALDRILEERIASRHVPLRSRWPRFVRRFQTARAILKEAASPRRSGQPADLLEIIAGARRDMSEEALVHLYLGFVFALAGSVGFTLGWALLLAMRHDRVGCPPPYMIREALRLYPIAWLLGRTAAHDIELLGERVSPDHVIAISPYAVHRNPVRWPEPTSFRPERWSGKIDRTAWLPFGAGGQSCVAASLSVEIADNALRALLDRPGAIEGGDGPPSVRAALAPPAFTLRR